MTWEHDPGVDREALNEEQARSDEAREHVAHLIAAKDFQAARRELEALEFEAKRKADTTEVPALIESGGTLADLRRTLDAADPMGAAGIRPVSAFAGRELPRPVLWMDARRGGGTVLRAGDVAILSGSGGVGKSFATLALAVAAADADGGGDPFHPPPGEACGLHVRRGPAVVLSYEDDAATVAWRAGLIAAKTGPDPGRVPDRMYLVDDPEPLMTADHDNPGDAVAAKDWRALWDGIAALSPSLVIVDPASAALAGVNQNDGATVRRFIRTLAREAQAGGWGTLIVAHSTKAARYGNDPGPGAVAGSGQWWDACRGVLHMRSDGPDRAAIECLKANHGPIGWAVTLEADRRKRDGKPDVFAGWKRVGRFSPEEWPAEVKRRDGKPQPPAQKGNGVRDALKESIL